MSEISTRLTIWLALLAYFIVTTVQLAAREREIRPNWLRWIWTFGCLAYLAHVVSAFQFFHHWSHRAALLHTAQVTESMTGWRSGVGLYMNYLFTVVWFVDVLWWWSNDSSRRLGRGFVRFLTQGFMFFIVFNATVVFGKGPVRWFGLIGCVIVLILFAFARVHSWFKPVSS